jgi:cell fate regulator YaaT (PSP1 superfamily)
LVVGVLVLAAMVGAAKATTRDNCCNNLVHDFTPLLMRDRETGSAQDLSWLVRGDH